MKHTITVIVVMIMGLTAVSAVAQQATNTETLQVQNGNEIRLYELGTNGQNYTSFKAAGSLSGEIKYTLPAALPTVNQVLSATAVSGTDVTLGWASSSSGTVKNYYSSRTTDATNNSTTTYVTVFTVTPSVSTTYMFRCAIRVKSTNNAADMDLKFTVPSGTTVAYTYIGLNVDATDFSGNVTDGTVVTNYECVNTGTWLTYELTGTITMGSTSGNVTVEYVADNASGTVTVSRGSNMMVWEKP